ncbi:MAG: hypothetical protein E6I92_02455 [Chloroflexi bacterium]|nr:MAG: hypothetical protein E6I92_02455 [Chloroflexota bacterium]
MPLSTAQSFLFFLILLGGAATALRLLSRRAPTVPYPVLLAVGGILIGLIPGLRLPPVGSDLILLAFVPGLVFEAALALDLDEMWRRVVPISLLATVGVFLTVVLIGAMAHYGLGLDWASGFLLGAICCASSEPHAGSRRSWTERACSTTARAWPSFRQCLAPSSRGIRR